MSEHRHRFPFTTLPTFSGGGDISFTLITHQTTQSDLAGDEVYFGEENAPFSYAVYLERADAITDRDIDQYIRSKDPDLHKKLFERRSRHVSRARALDNLTNSSSTAAKPRPTKAVQSSNSKSLKPRDQPIALQNTVDDVFSGYKELLVSALASGHQWALRIVLAVSPKVFCTLPFCHYHQDYVPKGTYILSLKVNTISTVSGQAESITVAPFCLTCVESIFDSRNAGLESVSTTGGYDGCLDRNDIIQAAERLLPRFDRPAKPVPLPLGPLPFNYPSNSPEAMYCRYLRNQETEEIEKHVYRYDKNKEDACNTTDATPKLVINRRKDTGGPQDRYKQQGRTYDSKRRRSSSPERRNVRLQDWAAQQEMLRRRESESICKCGEPSDHQPVIVCASYWCPIGRYHVACIGDSSVDSATGTWYCEACKEFCIPVGEDVQEDSSGVDTSQGSIETGTGTTGISSEENEVEVYRVADSDGPQTYPGADATPSLTADDSTEEIDRLYLMLDGPASPQKPTLLPAPELYDGLKMDTTASQHITFADMAPFIGIESDQPSGLTMRHLAALEQWKSFCPPSQLLPPTRNSFTTTDLPNFSYPRYMDPSQDLHSYPTNGAYTSNPIPSVSSPKGLADSRHAPQNAILHAAPSAPLTPAFSVSAPVLAPPPTSIPSNPSLRILPKLSLVLITLDRQRAMLNEVKNHNQGAHRVQNGAHLDAEIE